MFGRRRTTLLTLLMATAVLLAVAGSASAARPTGRYLVSLDRDSHARASTASASAVIARAGVRRAGPGVPKLRIATVRGSRAAIARLRRDPAVSAVSREWERDLRRVPNDPALRTPETVFTSGVPSGTPIQWALAREGFPAAWDLSTGGGSIVGIVDTGTDAGSPELGPKVASADAVGTTSPLLDSDGHGSHVSGLACANTGNGIGVAGAGWGCRLAVVKLGTTASGGLRDEDIVNGIRTAMNRGASVINLSFGGGPTNAALRRVIDEAVRRNVVLVAAASNDPVANSGAPAAELQPGNAADLSAGRGLVVTAADFFDRRAGTGFGGQVSVAAYGFFDAGTLGPPGMISTYTSRATVREGATFEQGCQCRRVIGGDRRYAYLAGTSMAVPQVAGLAALVSDLNPYLTLRDKLTIIKRSARRSGGWSPELGWGIINAGSALAQARATDRKAPDSRVRRKRALRLKRGKRSRRVLVRWGVKDRPGRVGLQPSGRTRTDLYMRRGKGRYRRVRRAKVKSSSALRLRRGVYRFYTVARDRSGNRELKPRKADLRLTVRRAKKHAKKHGKRHAKKRRSRRSGRR